MIIIIIIIIIILMNHRMFLKFVMKWKQIMFRMRHHPSSVLHLCSNIKRICNKYGLLNGWWARMIFIHELWRIANERASLRRLLEPKFGGFLYSSLQRGKMERRCRSFLLVVSLRIICRQQRDLFHFQDRKHFLFSLSKISGSSSVRVLSLQLL